MLQLILPSQHPLKVRRLISTSSLLKGAGLAGLVGALFTETGREFTAGILDGLGLKGVGDTFLKFANLLPTIEDAYKSIPVLVENAEKTFDNINQVKNKIYKLAQNPEKYNSIVKYSYDTFVKKYTWESRVRNIFKI